MTIPPITSLANLEFKAKADPYYRQLASLALENLGWYELAKQYPQSIEKLFQLSNNRGDVDCMAYTNHINLFRTRITFIEPEKKKVDPEKLKRVVESLRKKSVPVKRVRKILKRIR